MAQTTFARLVYTYINLLLTISSARLRILFIRCLACRLGRRFCLRQRSPPETRAPQHLIVCFELFGYAFLFGELFY